MSREDNSHDILELGVEGMTCQACVSRVEKAIMKGDSVDSVNVSLAGGTAVIKFKQGKGIDESDHKLEIEKLKDRVSAIGYRPYDLEDIFSSEHFKVKEKARKEGLRNFLISAFLTAPILLVSILMLFGVELYYSQVAIVEMFLTTLILFYPGHGINLATYKAAKNFTVDMNTLISLGTLSAYFYSSYLLIFNNFQIDRNIFNNLFFETAGVIISLLLLGRYLELRAKAKTGDAVNSLIKLQPEKATIVDGSEEVRIDVRSIKVGDIVLVYPGSVIPTDGEILEGEGLIVESMITGESAPVLKGKLAKVRSGSLNSEGSFKYEVTAVSKESTLFKIVKLIRQAESEKADIQRIADIVSAYFVAAVILIAALAFGYWYFIAEGSDLTLAVKFFVTTLIISCPCALGLATPVALTVGIGSGARNGIIVRNGKVLEYLSLIDTIFLDKTGTITKGMFELVDIFVLDKSYSKDDVLRIASSVEIYSEHPIGKAIVRRAKESEIVIPDAKDFKNKTGRYVSAVVNGKDTMVSSPQHALKFFGSTSEIKNILDDLSLKGISSVFVSVDKDLVAIIAIADGLKEGSALALSNLKKMVKKVVMLTGDRKGVAEYIAQSLRICYFYAELLPEDKVNHVSLATKSGSRVGMVGDGVNDAPALAVADVGFAMGKGVDITAETADIILTRDDLNDLVKSIMLGKAVLRTIKQNLGWAFGYNAILIPVAAGVFYTSYGVSINPMLAAAAMSFSSISVILNSLRLKSFS